jgi:hypothetical protein
MWRVLRGILNLGILAHVDAGKTTLTERLLYCAGVIDQPGSVDDGTTQTESLGLECQSGVTVKSAVVSFTVGGTVVNLIDTPGHPDFVAEVEPAADRRQPAQPRGVPAPRHPAWRPRTKRATGAGLKDAPAGATSSSSWAAASSSRHGCTSRRVRG